MKRIFLIFSFAALLWSCTKTNYIPDPGKEKEPQPVVSVLNRHTSEWTLWEMLRMTDQRSKNTFIETFKSESVLVDMVRHKYNTGYYQCFGPDGVEKWDKWVPVTDLPSEEYYNKTVFAVTSDGGIIDCFNVKDLSTGAQIPYIQKISANGELPWGKSGLKFHTFVQDLEQKVPPCEGYVAADHQGGAWVAAGNYPDSLVVARVDKDGRLSEMIKFDSNGTGGKKTYLSRPQMMVGDNDELFLLLQYADLETTIYKGYYDLVKISPDGQILSHENLMEEKFFSRGILGRICPDGKGGAYVAFGASKNDTHHVFLSHFNNQGHVDFKDVDINPSGSAGNVFSYCAAVDPQSDKCLTIIMDNTSFCTYLFAQTVDLDGKKHLGENEEPVLLLKTENYSYLDSSTGFKLIHYPGDNSLHLYYVYTKSPRYPLLKSCTISTDGVVTNERKVAELDVSMLKEGWEDNVDAIVDGTLGFWWYKDNSKNFYSFFDNLTTALSVPDQY